VIGFSRVKVRELSAVNVDRARAACAMTASSAYRRRLSIGTCGPYRNDSISTVCALAYSLQQ